MRRSACIVLLSVQAMVLSVVPIAAQTAAPDTDALGERLKARITTATSSVPGVRAAAVRGDEPPIGAAEPVADAASDPVTPESDPTILEQDLTSGFIAAGGVLLSAVLILFLVALVANSTHHKEKD